MIGKKINNYTIEKLLGEGGMGNVYLAHHEGMDRKVAIKAILPELVSKEEVKKRFLVEASTMSKLQHQSIVTLYDYVSNENGLFLIMEFVDGIQLDEYMKKLGKPIEEELAIEFTKQVVSACNHAHERGVVHRDIKPQNVMITSGGEVKILDFGIAKMMDDEVNNLTKTGTQLGTVYYMSPEQVKGEKITPATDIYAIGITLYQMVTGVKPYADLTTEYQIYDHIVKNDLPDARTLNTGVSNYLSKVIYKATRKSVSDRFLNCTDFSKVLDNQNELRAKYSDVKYKPTETVQKEVEPQSRQFNDKTKAVWNGINTASSNEIQQRRIKEKVPNSGGALTCGILGVVLSIGLFGPILSIIAIALASGGIKKYDAIPELYTEGSIKNAKAGQVLGIIGLILFALIIVIAIAANS